MKTLQPNKKQPVLLVPVAKSSNWLRLTLCIVYQTVEFRHINPPSYISIYVPFFHQKHKKHSSHFRETRLDCRPGYCCRESHMSHCTLASNPRKLYTIILTNHSAWIFCLVRTILIKILLYIYNERLLHFTGVKFASWFHEIRTVQRNQRQNEHIIKSCILCWPFHYLDNCLRPLLTHYFPSQYVVNLQKTS